MVVPKAHLRARRPSHEVQVLRPNVHVAEDHAVRSQVELVALIIEEPVVQLTVIHVPPEQDCRASLWSYFAPGAHEVYRLSTPGLSACRRQPKTTCADGIPVVVLGTVEHLAEAHEVGHGQLLAKALFRGYVAVAGVTLKCRQRDVDVPVLDTLVHELTLQMDREPGLAIAEKKSKDLQRPLVGLQHWKVLELRVVEPTQVAVRA